MLEAFMVNSFSFRSYTELNDNLLYLDYIKVGKYNSKYGSLEYPSTNQRLYDIKNNKDITNLFWKTNIK